MATRDEIDMRLRTYVKPHCAPIDDPPQPGDVVPSGLAETRSPA